MALDVGVPTAHGRPRRSSPSRRSAASTSGSTTRASTRSGCSSDTPDDVFERDRCRSTCTAVVRGSRAALAQFRARRAGVLINVVVDDRRPRRPLRERVRDLEVGGARLLVRAARGAARRRPASTSASSGRRRSTRRSSGQSANFSGRRIKALTPTYAPEQAARTIAGLIERPRREVDRRPLRARRSHSRATLAPGLVDRIFARRAVRRPVRRRRAGGGDDRQPLRAGRALGRRVRGLERGRGGGRPGRRSEPLT